MAVYLAVENPSIRHDQAGLRGVIGPRATASDPALWDDTARSVRDTATDIVVRQLIHHHDQSGAPDVSDIVRHRPEWLTEHLHALADTGGLVNTDIRHLGALVRDVHVWRIDHNLADRTDAAHPLGLCPTDPLGRAQHTQLQRRLATPRGADTSRGIT